MSKEPMQRSKLTPDDETNWYANYVLGTLLVAYVFSFVDRNILALMVGPLRRDLGISDFEISLLQGPAFALFYSTMALPVAHLADTRRRTAIIACGVAVWSAMTAGCGLVRSFIALFLLRLGVGLGEAALSPPAASLLSDYFHPRRYPRAMAIFSLGIGVGTGMSFLIGGAVVELVSGASTVSVPLLGEIRPWQLTFLVIGIPGLLIAALMATIREPERRGAILDGEGQVEVIPLSEVFQFIGQRWRLYINFPIATGFLGIFGYGMAAWYPTFLIRTFGFSAGEAGGIFGLIYVIVGPLGTLFGVRLAERLQTSGYRDAHVRFIMLAGLGMMVFGTIGPLMPNPGLALTFLVPAVFLKCSYLGSSSSAMQLVTPNQLRAKVTALQIFFANIIGMTIGASGIAFLTDFVFVDDLAIRYSLSWVAAVTCLLGAVVSMTCLKPYSRALDEAHERTEAAARAAAQAG
jgi:MFS family permease